MKLKIFILVIIVLPFMSRAQLGAEKTKFTRADTLRGSLNENRNWWDVLRYDIEVKPDYKSKNINGKTKITFSVVSEEKYKKRLVDALLRKDTLRMQIDLQDSLVIDSIVCDSSVLVGKIHGPARDSVVGKKKLKYDRYKDYVVFDFNEPIHPGKIDSLIIYYHGIPKAAKNAPWDGGWIWKTDSLGRPWMSVAVQGLGASAWYPCKDHQSDEPDNGASLTMIIPDTLVGVGNGRLVSKTGMPGSGLTAYKWEVKNPINNYNIVPYIGKYVNWTDTLNGEKETLDLSYWVLDYNLEKSKKQFQQAKTMLHCFEYWFGPYPFYEDGYKLVDAPHLGMEHQSAVAYGNGYRNGYRGRDLSGTGWGTKWDFIIIHESGHEWFANNITTRDIADMWVHEGFTNYSETLYTEWLFGKQAADEYNYGIRRNIRNDAPIIGPYGVNKEGSGDMYYKAGNMLHTIRKVINDDRRFREILRGLNRSFWHQTVSTAQVERYIAVQAGINFHRTFDQYLRTTQVPRLEFYFDKKKTEVFYRWTNCIERFDLPLVINNRRVNITTKWNSTKLSKADLSYWDPAVIEKQYYITAKQVSKP